jgi:hypothetical protein
MSETRIRRPASDTRPARRSLVELTAAASRAVDDSLFVTSAGLIAASPDDPTRSEHAAKVSDRTVVARQAAAPLPVAVTVAQVVRLLQRPIPSDEHIGAALARLEAVAVRINARRVPEFLNAAVSRSDELVDSDSTAEMVVKIAKDCQNRAFQNIQVSLNAALDHVRDFAETRVGSEGASKDDGGASLDDSLTVLKGATVEFRAEALELMNANVITTLEYARELAGTTTAAEFVELSSAQARKQCELILKQAGALRSLTQTITKPSAD